MSNTSPKTPQSVKQPLLQSLRILKYQKETRGNKLTIKAFSLASDLSLPLSA